MIFWENHLGILTFDHTRFSTRSRKSHPVTSTYNHNQVIYKVSKQVWFLKHTLYFFGLPGPLFSTFANFCLNMHRTCGVFQAPPSLFPAGSCLGTGPIWFWNKHTHMYFGSCVALFAVSVPHFPTRCWSLAPSPLTKTFFNFRFVFLRKRKTYHRPVAGLTRANP